MKPEIITKAILKKVYKPRPKQAHKYDFGALIVIGGSEKYSGSPAFNARAGKAALAAYRSGVDIVEVIAPKRAADIIARLCPDMITIPIKGNNLKLSHLKKVLEETKNKSAFVIGGGIGREKSTQKFIISFLNKINLPGVIDAGAIYAINKKVKLKNCIITPHAYEFFILTGKKIARNLKLNQKIKIVKQEAAKLNTTILLKGHIDIISDGKKVAINKTGNPYMSVGGTGDVLTGVAGSLLAQGNSVFDSACAAAYINGLAGDNAARRRKAALMASDLIEEIAKIVAGVS